MHVNSNERALNSRDNVDSSCPNPDGHYAPCDEASRFMQLPKELRLHIYSYLIYQVCEPAFESPVPFDWTDRRFIYRHVFIAPANLLGTSKTIRMELTHFQQGYNARSPPIIILDTRSMLLYSCIYDALQIGTTYDNVWLKRNEAVTYDENDKSEAQIGKRTVEIPTAKFIKAFETVERRSIQVSVTAKETQRLRFFMQSLIIKLRRHTEIQVVIIVENWTLLGENDMLLSIATLAARVQASKDTRLATHVKFVAETRNEKHMQELRELYTSSGAEDISSASITWEAAPADEYEFLGLWPGPRSLPRSK